MHHNVPQQRQRPFVVAFHDIFGLGTKLYIASPLLECVQRQIDVELHDRRRFRRALDVAHWPRAVGQHFRQLAEAHAILEIIVQVGDRERILGQRRLRMLKLVVDVAKLADDIPSSAEHAIKEAVDHVAARLDLAFSLEQARVVVQQSSCLGAVEEQHQRQHHHGGKLVEACLLGVVLEGFCHVFVKQEALFHERGQKLLVIVPARQRFRVHSLQPQAEPCCVVAHHALQAVVVYAHVCVQACIRSDCGDASSLQLRFELY